MENNIIENKKSSKGILLLLIILGLVVVGFGIFIGIKYIGKGDNKSNNNSSNSVDVNTTSDTARDSDIKNPLKINEWGKTSKRVDFSLDNSYLETEYVDVPIRVTKITRGKEAEKMVKEWFTSQKLYSYQEPKNTTEWLVVDYEVDYSNLKFKLGGIGTSIKISSELKGLGGGSLKHNKINYLLSTKDTSKLSYVTEPGIYKGQFISNIPIGCTDYLIKFCDVYNKTSAFIKGQ